MSVNTKVNGELVKSAGLYKVRVPIQSGDIYSLEERQIGVWTDGKPLYQRTFFVTGSYSGSGYVDLGLTNTDTIWLYSAFFNDDASNILPLPFPHPLSESTRGVFIDDQHRLAYRTLPNGTFMNPVVTIRYTKTTDVAGSGEYVPSGDKAEHYSENEEVIGTFMGETLYRKVYAFNENVTISMTSWTNVNSYISNIGFSTFVKCYGIDANGTYQGEILCGLDANNQLQMLSPRNGNASIAVTKIILEYTKTS